MGTFGNISSKGQIVIPAKLRKELGFEAGNPVVFSNQDGKLVISKPDRNAIDALYGKYAGLPLEEDLVEEKYLERKREDRKIELT